MLNMMFLVVGSRPTILLNSGPLFKLDPPYPANLCTLPLLKLLHHKTTSVGVRWRGGKSQSIMRRL
ncbi:hypothetical protein Taro_027174 [Colocasia esculenta]|uniref:Uncharacterized protein n=1 Tax=Colocasia esculenta TaxID=4460 RepID=A0A843VHB6_COLES|nr:hypothetical protein [Colocasia esculenta]